MYASKEEAKQAKEELLQAAFKLGQHMRENPMREQIKNHLLKIRAFLDVAEAKLPKAASYDKDRIRRKH